LAEHRARGDARRALERAKAALPAQVRERTEVVVRRGPVEGEIVEVAQQMNAELTLLGQAESPPIRRAIYGSRPERVLRRLRRPVLVARSQAPARYERPLLALREDAAAEAALALLLRVVSPPRPTLSLVHVFQGPPLGMIFPALSLAEAQDVRRSLRGRAVASVDALLERARCGVGVVSWRAQLLSGHAPSLVRDTALRMQSDLLVLGTRASSRAAQIFRDSVFRRSLNEARCDLLVVPAP
jgi:nucleotide-binding universal stress UspA family protein